ncbi:MAG: cytochrome b/b6 domain-containing protein [Hyphomicrobium sp.]|nr:cytochrome b/b6 domain-containing protein [Hyphomicrobium sp.]
MVSSAVVPQPEIVYRHTLAVRITHWVNAFCLLVLLLSGLQIFNAHPTLYFGDKSDPDRAVLSMKAIERDDGSYAGITTIGSARFDTTGVLGLSRDANGELESRGFPYWITLPSYRDLATGRRWHFFFAWLFVLNGLAYLIYAAWSGHVRRDLAPTRSQLRHIGQSVWEHIRFRFPKGEEAKSYNVLQKLAYLAVIFGLLPLIVLTGLTMSPAMDAAFPFLLDMFGGRQSARTIHFLCAAGITAFVVVHLVMVVATGTWNNIRSMITGRYVIEPEEAPHGK